MGADFEGKGVCGGVPFHSGYGPQGIAEMLLANAQAALQRLQLSILCVPVCLYLLLELVRMVIEYSTGE